MLSKFIQYLENEAANHSIYVWGAQGQKAPLVNEAWIRKHETSVKNAERAVNYWQQQVDAGYGDVLRAFDCSGLGVCFLLENKLIKSDMNANGFMGKCRRISRDELRTGDFVFNTNSSGRATHIGYVVDDGHCVIEAKGRDYGVVKSTLGDWDVYGRPPYWDVAAPDKPAVKPGSGVTITEGIVFTRVLKNGCVGADVCELKRLLAAAGFGGVTQGNKNFYGKTESIVKAFQKAKGLEDDGKAGPLTITALGGVWAG